MTTLSDAFQAIPDNKDRPQCTVGALLKQLDTADTTTLTEMLGDPDVTHARISRALTYVGHTMSAGAIGRHRQHDCRCPQ